MRKLGYAGKLFGEFIGFARANRAYWIIPLALLLAAMGVLIVASETAAPFIYALF